MLDYHKPQTTKAMQLNTYEQLADCQRQIYNALWSSTRSDKENAFNYVCQNIPNMKSDLDNKWKYWSKQAPGREYWIVNDISSVSYLGLEMNLRFCNEIISERMRIDFHSPISPNAVQIVFFSPEPLQQNTVLYEEKSEDGSEKRLKVSDFLDVLSYAKKFAEANLDADFDKYNGGLMAMRTVDLAIHHKPVDKPLNKSLHLVNDILTEYAKSISKDKEAKRDATGISLLVDLAIDFLVRG